jgi:hypothetical protein
MILGAAAGRPVAVRRALIVGHSRDLALTGRHGKRKDEKGSFLFPYIGISYQINRKDLAKLNI